MAIRLTIVTYLRCPFASAESSYQSTVHLSHVCFGHQQQNVKVTSFALLGMVLDSCPRPSFKRHQF